jgi:hypothetical protein
MIAAAMREQYRREQPHNYYDKQPARRAANQTRW